jgi:hypothetical protein
LGNFSEVEDGFNCCVEEKADDVKTESDTVDFHCLVIDLVGCNTFLEELIDCEDCLKQENSRYNP